MRKMPTLKINDAEIYFEDHGEGPEAIVFAHGLLPLPQFYRQMRRAGARRQSRHTHHAGGGHTATVEEPVAVNDVLDKFLGALGDE